MTRHEDIPERVWAEATRMAREYHQWLNAGNSTGSLSEHAVLAMADTFARAILAAEKREREACAQIAREHDMASGESIAHMIMTRNEWQPAAVRKVLESSDA